MSAVTLREPAVLSPAVAVGDDDLYEIIDGKRVGLPPMAIYSVLLATQLVRYLGNFADAKQLGRAVAEGLFHLPAPVNRDRRPDVAFVSYQRWPKTRSVPRTDNAWDVVPNLTTEVVSPTDSVVELEQKIAEYFQVGVELVWVVYPSQTKIHVCQSPTQIQVLTTTDVLDGGAVLPGFRLPLADLFVEPAENADVARESRRPSRRARGLRDPVGVSRDSGTLEELAMLQEYDVVRVETLSTARPNQSVGKRLPAVGDLGTIVFVLAPGEFIVEAVANDGSTLWLSDFSATDLSLVTRPRELE